MRIYAIDELPELKKVLGKARTDRIRYHARGTGKRQKGATNIENTLQPLLVDVDHIPEAVNDMLTGAARAVDNTLPLSVSRLWKIFQCIPIINTKEIQNMTGLDERQARRYMQAAKMVFPILQRQLGKTPDILDDDCLVDPYGA